MCLISKIVTPQTAITLQRKNLLLTLIYFFKLVVFLSSDASFEFSLFLVISLEGFHLLAVFRFASPPVHVGRWLLVGRFSVFLLRFRKF